MPKHFRVQLYLTVKSEQELREAVADAYESDSIQPDISTGEVLCEYVQTTVLSNAQYDDLPVDEFAAATFDEVKESDR